MLVFVCRHVHMHVRVRERTFFFILDKYLGAGLLSCMVSVCLNLLESAKLSAKLFAKMAVPLCIGISSV